MIGLLRCELDQSFYKYIKEYPCHKKLFGSVIELDPNSQPYNLSTRLFT
jgi:hypothetical protein